MSAVARVGVRPSGVRVRGRARVAAGAGLHLCLWALATPGAQAGRPMATDDAAVLDARDCEWDAYAAALHSAGRPRSSAWQTQLSCGVGAGAQLSTNVSANDDGAERRRVVGLGGKLRWFGDTSADAQAWRGTATFNVDMLRLNDSRFEIQDNGVNLVVSRSFAGSWTGHANLGWSYSRLARSSRTTWNLAFEDDLGGQVDATAEVYGDDRSPAWLGAGVRWSPVKRSSVNASFSVQGTRPSAARLLTVGYTLAF